MTLDDYRDDSEHASHAQPLVEVRITPFGAVGSLQVDLGETATERLGRIIGTNAHPILQSEKMAAVLTEIAHLLRDYARIIRTVVKHEGEPQM
jgi:hypothetical protein